MGTRSTIWIKNEDNSYSGIYCHWDGYPSNNGKILLQNYQDEAKIRTLISLGDASVLDAKCDKPEGHSYEAPTKGYTVFYHRDRGEDFNSSTAKTEEDTKQEEYSYLFKDGKWVFSDHGRAYNELTLDACKD